MRKQKLLKNSSFKLSWLLSLIAFLAVGQNVYATFEGATYYFDNNVAQWEEVYMIIGKSDYAQARQMTEDENCSGIFKLTLSDWNDATKFFFAESTCGFNTATEKKSIDTTPTCSKYTKKITAKPSEFLFVPSASSGTDIDGTWNHFVTCDPAPADVLNGTKIMCYGGEAVGWNQTTYYLKNTSTKANEASGTMSGSYTISNVAFEFAPLTVAAGTYIHGHWDSGLSGGVVAGGSYIVYGSTPSGYTKITDGSGNTLSKKENGTTTVTFTADASITTGSNLSITNVSAAGTSSIGNTNGIQWYISVKDANEYTQYTLTDGVLNTSALAAGTYTLKAVLTDNQLYVVGGSQDFTVQAPAPTGDAPTVLLGANPEVSGAVGTLHGYLKLTGCNDVTAYGFVWSTDQSVISPTTPTGGTSVPATSPTGDITVGNYGTEFTLANYEFTSQTTIYYKAYATNVKGTSYSEMGQFSTSGCVKPVVSSIEVPATICSTAGTITATATAIDGATYAWEVDGTSFTAASGTTYQASITVGTAGTGSISVTPTKDGCQGNKFTLNDIEVKSSAIAAKNLKVNDVSTTEGETINFCQGDEITFKITSDNKVDTYTWSFPSGWTYVSGEGTKEVVVTASATSGTVTATISNDCGKSDTRTITANVTAIPATPDIITGDAAVCKQTDHTYTIEAVADATGYEWILPAGWSGTCGATGNILNARAGANAESGTIKVKATNSCGSSAYNTGKEVTVSGYSIVITGTGAKSASATYPWELFTLTATTDAENVTWNAVYSTALDPTLTVLKQNGKSATLKSGAPVSDTEHYTVTATSTDGGCESTSDGYDVYINAAQEEICGD